MKSISLKVNVNLLVLLICRYVSVIQTTLLQIPKIKNTQLCSLWHEKCIHIRNLDMLTILHDPHIVNHSGRVVMQHPATAKPHYDHERVTESMPPPEERIKQLKAKQHGSPSNTDNIRSGQEL